MLQDVEAVIFDLDGTLIDSMWMWNDINIEYLDKFGAFPPKDLQEIVEGMSVTETANYFKSRFNIPDSIDKIKEDWHYMSYSKYMNEVKVKEGAIELLMHLKSNNIKTGIATSNSRKLVDSILEKFNMGQYFDSVRTSCEVGKGKPSPDIYLQVAKDLEVEPDKCLIFEDVVHGVMAGKNANMKVCAVYDKNSHRYTSQIKELSDYYINTFKDIQFSM